MDDIWSALANAATIAGFGLLGILVSVLWISRRLARFLVRGMDRRALGKEFEPLYRLAVRDPSFEDKSPMSLRSFLANTRRELAGAVRESALVHLRQLLAEPTAGSTHLRNEDLFASDVLLMPIRFSSLDGTRTVSLRTLKGALTGAAPVRRFLVIGDAGAGKSVALMGLANELLHSQADRTPWPFVLLSSDFERRTDASLADIGSERWCVDTLAARCLLEDATALQRLLLQRLIEGGTLILLDSLDELVQRLDAHEIDRLFRSWLFSNAHVVVCRKAFYYSTLLGNVSIDGLEVLEVQLPPEAAARTFVAAAAARMGANHPEAVFVRMAELFRVSPGIRTLAATPLLLTMLVELLTEPASPGIPAATATIYEAFIFHSIRREGARSAHSSATWSLVLPLLQELAASLLLRSTGRTRIRTAIDRRTISAAIRAVAPGIAATDEVALEEALRSLPILRSTPGRTPETGRGVHFQHESFAEFLLAQRVYYWIIGASERGADFFTSIDTPEVSYYLKEYLSLIRQDPDTRSRAQERLKNLFDSYLTAVPRSTSEAVARSLAFAAGQIGYYFGMVADEQSHSILASIVRSGADFWVRRAVAIGLAFGGYPDSLDFIVDNMWNGIDKGDFSEARKNIGIELGFYGDQEFDILDPVSDKGGTTCRKTVARIALQCRLLVECPNARMDLFDLVYLGRYREASRADFALAFEAERDHLLAWTSLAARSPSLASSRELPMLREMLTELQSRLPADAEA